ncbi:MAG: phage tail tape measure protein [Deltaproteobacteria bacterium]|nr:phage tail tape measure protein [Deltaproteobacteria bacterium]
MSTTADLALIVRTEMAAAIADFNEMNTSVDDSADSVDNLSQGLGDAENAAEAAGEGIRDAARLVMRSTQEIAQEMNDLQDDFHRMENSGEESLEDIARAARLLNRELNRLESELDDIDNAASDIDGDGFGDLKSQLLGVLSAAVSFQAALEGIKFFAAFDDELRKVKAFSKSTAEEFKQLEQLAIDIGRRPAQTPREVAEGMVALAQAGQSANDMLRTTASVANLAADSELNFAESAGYVSKAMAQFQLDVGDASRVVDVIVEASLSATQTAGDFGEAMSYVGSVANSIGYDLEQTGSLITALAAAGLEGGRGGTALGGGLARLINPAGDAKDVIADINLEVFKVNGQFKDFAEIIGDVGEATLTPRQQVQLWGQEAGPGMAALVAIGEEAIRDYEEALRDAAGTAQEVSDIMHEGIGGSLRAIASEAQVAALEGIEPLIPLVQLLAEGAHHLSTSVHFIIGPVKGFQAALMAGYGGVQLIRQGAGFLTDTLGLTSDAAKEAGRDVDAAFGASGELFSDASDAYKKIAVNSKELGESQKWAADMANNLNDEFKKISKETGVTVKSMEDVEVALARGLLRQDENTGKFISAEQDKQSALKATAKAAVDAINEVIKEDKAARSAAKKIWEDYRETVKDVQDDILDRESNLKAELDEMARSGMSVADAHKAIKAEAENALVSAKALQEAGDLEGALKSADAAADAYKDFAGDVRSAASDLDRSKEQLKDALKDYKTLKKDARKDGVISKDEKKNIRAARKEIKELKKEVKENEKALVGEKEALEEAMKGVEAAGKLAIDIQGQVAAEAKSAGSAIDEAFKFSEAEEKLQALIDKAVGVGAPLAESMTAAKDSSLKDIAEIDSGLDDLEKPRTVTFTITEKTIQAAFHGGQIRSATDMRAGAQVNGPPEYDSVYAVLAGGEAVTKGKRVRELGYNRVMRPINDGHYDKAMQGIAAYLGPSQTREILSNYLVPPAHDMVMMAPPPDMPTLAPVQPGAGGGHEFPKLGTIILQNDRTGDRFPVYAKPQDAPKLAAFLDDPSIKLHGQGGR